MIVGVGCDIVCVSRISGVYAKFGRQFVDKILANSEIDLFDNRNHDLYTLAKCFSVKESVFKAISAYVRNIVFKDIEVMHNNSGMPIVLLRNCTRALVPNNVSLHITISDELDYVMTYAIAEMC